MLDDKDIQRLKDIFLTKEEFIELGKEIFVTKGKFEDFREELRKKLSDLHSAIDAYAKKVDTFAQEMIMRLTKLIAMKNGFIKSLRN